MRLLFIFLLFVFSGMVNATTAGLLTSSTGNTLNGLTDSSCSAV